MWFWQIINTYTDGPWFCFSPRKNKSQKKKPNQSQCMEIISQKWLTHVITLKAVHKPYMYMNTPTNFYVLNTHWAIELRSSYHKLHFSPQKILTHFCIKAWKCITCTKNHNNSTVDIKNTTFARAPPFFFSPCYIGNVPEVEFSLQFHGLSTWRRQCTVFTRPLQRRFNQVCHLKIFIL